MVRVYILVIVGGCDGEAWLVRREYVCIFAANTYKCNKNCFSTQSANALSVIDSYTSSKQYFNTKISSAYLHQNTSPVLQNSTADKIATIYMYMYEHTCICLGKKQSFSLTKLGMKTLFQNYFKLLSVKSSVINFCSSE